MANKLLDWTAVTQQGSKVVGREQNTDGVFMELRKNAEKLVRVHIGAVELKAFGEAPNGDKAAHSERVLRAILETYINKIGEPPSDIYPRDLAAHLHPLQNQFRMQSGDK